ncbi:MAG: hydrogen peroxide-inducible genes activator [Minwuiales bacterium]|nr:hydrogen peroxide-inducible genes activator [Minwuiales bacterium]
MQINALTIKHLRYFSAIAKFEHFARAADFCAISQPALSLQIKQMEELVGAPLVERNTRNVRLTNLGRAIAVRAEHVLQAVDEIGDLVRATAGEFTGLFRLGVIPTIAPYLLPEAMKRLTHNFPRLEIVLRETFTHVLIGELQSGDLDAAILALPIAEPTLTEVELFSEDFLLVRPIKDTGKPVPDVKGLRKLKLLLLEEGHCFRDQALSFCGAGKARPKNIMDGSSLTTLVQLVGSGVGVTLIPEMAARIETRLAGVETVRFADPQPSRRIGMVWRKTNPLEKQLTQISETIYEAAEALTGR